MSFLSITLFSLQNMAIPDFDTFMLPTLNYAADKQEHSVRALL